MACRQCMSGDRNLCLTAEQTIVQRHGGFADRVRADWAWVVPLPEVVDSAKAGPPFCGGATVFNPIVQFDVQPTGRVGVIGIGGLGRLALQFLNKWGCEVTAFTSSDSKREEAPQLGAHAVKNSRDSAAMTKIAGSMNFVISTVNISLDWPAILDTLAPKGRLHLVGVCWSRFRSRRLRSSVRKNQSPARQTAVPPSSPRCWTSARGTASRRSSRPSRCRA